MSVVHYAYLPQAKFADSEGHTHLPHPRIEHMGIWC